MKKIIKKRDLVVFALIWALIFTVIALYPIIGGSEARGWFLGIAGVFLAVGFVKPTALQGFYRVWVKIGEFIGGIVSKVILLVLFFGLFTPISLMLKILGKDLLRKKINRNESTYWIQREDQPQSMKNQF